MSDNRADTEEEEGDDDDVCDSHDIQAMSEEEVRRALDSRRRRWRRLLNVLAAKIYMGLPMKQQGVENYFRVRNDQLWGKFRKETPTWYVVDLGCGDRWS